MSLPSATPLLAVEASRARALGRSARLFPIALGLFLLFANAYMERYLTDDPDGFTIHLFLFLHASLFAAIAAEHFVSVSSDVLRKSAVYPVRPWTRFLFVAGSLLRLPSLRALWAVDAFSLAIIFRAATPALIIAPLSCTLLLLSLIALGSLILLVVTRLEHRAAAVAIAGAWGAVAVLLLSTLFQVPSLLKNLPLLHSAAEAIASTGRGETWSALLDFVPLLLTITGSALVARKYA